MWPSLYPPVSPSKLTRKGAGALLAQPDPLGQWLRFSIRRLIHDVAHLPHVGHGDFAAAQAANGRNQRTRTNPTLFPSLRIARMATFTGVESVPMPTRTISASAVSYSSKNGFP